VSPWPSQAVAEMDAFYGNPDPHGEGVPDRIWENANLVAITPPYPMVLAWAPTTPLRTIRVHRKCADSLARVLEAIRAHYLTPEALQAARLHLYGGCYGFRAMRGNPRLSVHSWGAAIDLDPANNRFGQKWNPAGGMPTAVANLFAAEGWVWGGLWSTPDAMHFQAATL
jgi:hypothetical protein